MSCTRVTYEFHCFLPEQLDVECLPSSTMTLATSTWYFRRKDGMEGFIVNWTSISGLRRRSRKNLVALGSCRRWVRRAPGIQLLASGEPGSKLQAPSSGGRTLWLLPVAACSWSAETEKSSLISQPPKKIGRRTNVCGLASRRVPSAGYKNPLPSPPTFFFFSPSQFTWSSPLGELVTTHYCRSIQACPRTLQYFRRHTLADVEGPAVQYSPAWKVQREVSWGTSGPKVLRPKSLLTALEWLDG